MIYKINRLLTLVNMALKSWLNDTFSSATSSLKLVAKNEIVRCTTSFADSTTDCFVLFDLVLTYAWVFLPQHMLQITLGWAHVAGWFHAWIPHMARVWYDLVSCWSWPKSRVFLKSLRFYCELHFLIFIDFALLYTFGNGLPDLLAGVVTRRRYLCSQSYVHMVSSSFRAFERLWTSSA